jgi:hypothetical protein
VKAGLDLNVHGLFITQSRSLAKMAGSGWDRKKVGRRRRRRDRDGRTRIPE